MRFGSRGPSECLTVRLGCVTEIRLPRRPWKKPCRSQDPIGTSDVHARTNISALSGKVAARRMMYFVFALQEGY